MILNPKSVPILILSGEGHKMVLDLFLSVAYNFYKNKLNHIDTIPIMLEEHKQIETNNNTILTPEQMNA